MWNSITGHFMLLGNKARPHYLTVKEPLHPCSKSSSMRRGVNGIKDERLMLLKIYLHLPAQTEPFFFS